MGQLIAAVMEAYADRPALGRRATTIVTDPAGRRSQQLLDNFETTTYRQVWADVRALASVWQHDEHMKVRPGDLVCILGFAGAGYVIADLAGQHLGAVSVPLQTNAPIPTLMGIVADTQPRCLATSIECLDDAVEIVLGGHRARQPARARVLRRTTTNSAKAFERAATRLAAAGVTTRLETMQAACQRGRSLPAPALVRAGADGGSIDDDLLHVGQHGFAQGRHARRAHVAASPGAHPMRRPLIMVNYMPMNHSFGRILVVPDAGRGWHVLFHREERSVHAVRRRRSSSARRSSTSSRASARWSISATRPNSHGPAGREARPAEVEADVRERQFGGRLMSRGLRRRADDRGTARISSSAVSTSRCPNGYGATEVMGVTMNNKVMRPPVIDWKLDRCARARLLPDRQAPSAR